MTIESRIGHIVEALADFGSRSYIPADAVLREFFLKRKYLGSSDRRDIAIPYYAIVKNYLRLEALHLDATAKEEIYPELIVAAYFIVFESKTLAELKKIIASMNNDYAEDHPLEHYEVFADRDRENVRLNALSNDERMSVYYSMPFWFVRKISEQYGTAAETVIRSLNDEAPVTLRANTLVTTRDEVIAYLRSKDISAEPTKLSPDGILLEKRINAMEHDLFRKGGFEIQDEGSQMIPRFAGDLPTSAKILDACAGAGGKSLHFSALLKNKGEIFATDVDDRKLVEFRKRAKRSSSQNIRIFSFSERKKFLGRLKGSFDAVLLDVPCTGTGTLRRNPSIKWNLTETMLSDLIKKQQKIVEENISYVKSGGTLLYATCSLLDDECSRQAEWITSQYPEFTLEAEMRTRPDVDGCDGFYVARLRRTT